MTTSPVLELHYTTRGRRSYSGRLLVGEFKKTFMNLMRRDLVDMFVWTVRGFDVSQALVTIDGSDPHIIHPSTLHKLREGNLSAADVCIGELLNDLEAARYQSFSPQLEIRQIPETLGWECVVCGQCSGLDGEELSCFCGAEMPLHTHHDGRVTVDIQEILDSNPEIDRFFMNRPWNPTPPWMSRSDLTTLLEQEKAHG